MKRSKDRVRYDVDGSVIKNTLHDKKVWNLREILDNPGQKAKARRDAQEFIKTTSHAPQQEEQGNDDLPWSEGADEIFFCKQKRGLATFFLRRGSPKYDEFKGFYRKYRSLREWKLQKEKLNQNQRSKGQDLREESETLRHAIVLFHDYHNKQQAAAREKIEKDRQELPITKYEKAIIYTLRKHRVLLIAGDTGCGKSTQVPQMLLKAGFSRIACTQPRRIACSSLAKRVSYETMNEYGSEIAYQVRFEGTATTRTRALFLTEGLLLRQYANDRKLSRYDVIVVDEVHERHLIGDFLLGILKQLLKERDDMHVILMSATLNAELFAQYFDAPAIMVPGKMFDVKIMYMPNEKEDKNLVDEAEYQRRQRLEIKTSVASRSERISAAPYLKIMDYIDQSVPSTERGDLLIFMSGIEEITTLAEGLTPYAEQTKAETSVTIDGIRFIIDSGKVKELSHDANCNMSKLSEFWISKASAAQRTGRAGRTGPGECFRLYSENEYNHMNEFAVPEIQRAPLEHVVLDIKALELGSPHEYDFIEKPSPIALESSINLLKALEALSSDEQVTPLGKVLADLPIDAVLGKMLIMSTVFHLVDQIIIIAAGMSVQSPFIRLPRNANPEITKNRRTLDSPHGDPFTLLNLWKAWLDVKAQRGESSRSWCKRHGVEEQRLYEITKLKKQFEKILSDFQPGILAELEAARISNQMLETDRMQKRDLLRKERRQQRQPKRRKILDMTSIDEENMEDVLDSSTDIRDLEFSLTNDLDTLRSRNKDQMEPSTVNLIKLIICSGLYPQFAFPDEHNPYRKSNELIFHTQAKRFLSLHPSSVLAAHPEWIQGTGENVRKDDADVMHELRHEFLCYLQLLETNKPYIVNLLRVAVDINHDCSVIVFDRYYMLSFRTLPVAEHVLELAHRLRTIWSVLINERIQLSKVSLRDDTSHTKQWKNDESTMEKLPAVVRKIAETEDRIKQKHADPSRPMDKHQFQMEVDSLCGELSIFMETLISAELRLAKSTELLKMYKVKRADDQDADLPVTWNPRFVEHSGIQITDYMWYNSINAESTATSIPEPEPRISDNTPMFWGCRGCETTFTFTRRQIFEHVANCNIRSANELPTSDEIATERTA
ncbi:hypothetical protein INT43_003553 [Umbelopsis isabellina]|uniref:P-loop containing nucleoside triphosphate hydrolase protein n=1 Tax=Mortierella isabellina TaxID=91625 RepID=A0A8H7PTU4_MORIS|nr:hypothetical protein INT43_003553 [Umbelopsis isabellina]